MTPRITYGIPTMGSRPELLERAIGSALGQTLPAQVLVSFQGDEIARREAAAKWQDHPLVRFAESPATNLWQNWCHVAAECETPYFAWLQDDDILAQGDATADAHQWPDGNAGRYGGIDHRAGMNTGKSSRQRIEQRSDARVISVGIGSDDTRSGKIRCSIGPHDHCSCAA